MNAKKLRPRAPRAAPPLADTPAIRELGRRVLDEALRRTCETLQASGLLRNTASPGSQDSPRARHTSPGGHAPGNAAPEPGAHRAAPACETGAA